MVVKDLGVSDMVAVSITHNELRLWGVADKKYTLNQTTALAITYSRCCKSFKIMDASIIPLWLIVMWLMLIYWKMPNDRK